jgi:hypothetical protein
VFFGVNNEYILAVPVSYCTVQSADNIFPSLSSIHWINPVCDALLSSIDSAKDDETAGFSPEMSVSLPKHQIHIDEDESDPAQSVCEPQYQFCGRCLSCQQNKEYGVHVQLCRIATSC